MTSNYISIFNEQPSQMNYVAKQNVFTKKILQPLTIQPQALSKMLHQEHSNFSLAGNFYRCLRIVQNISLICKCTMYLQGVKMQTFKK